MHFRVNLYAVFAIVTRNSLLDTDAYPVAVKKELTVLIKIYLKNNGFNCLMLVLMRVFFL